VLVASCHEGVLDPHGPVGKAERVILYDSTVIMLAVVIPVIVLTLVFAWWPRAQKPINRQRPSRDNAGVMWTRLGLERTSSAK
jgi:cytochrome o ubiquinol oxidase subunit 2